MLDLHGEVRFLGIENDRATMKIVIQAEDDADAARRAEVALRAVFGNGYGFGGPNRVIGPVDPFPDHPLRVDDDEARLRIQAAGSTARALGYHITVSEAPNMPAEEAYMAHVAQYTVGGTSTGRWVCYAPMRETAYETALEIIRAHIEHGEPWPEHD